MDQMVLTVQRWLNTTYGSNPNYKVVTEDGITGGTTVSALIRALQIEIGIASPDGVFGPGTLAACPTLPSSSTTKNKVYILQGALYCKGYNPNGFDGGYGTGVSTAIKKFQSDAGLTTQDGITTPKIFQALLNTDAYILVSGGDSNIRTIQQNLNRDYNVIMSLIPTNGVYSRSTNIALIKALQHEEGITADGIWGNNTMKACPVIPGSNATPKYILLLQYSLYCNGYNANGFDGVAGPGVISAIRGFQEFSGLTMDGYAGPQTWASLLVSTGDPNRKGTVCDCSTTITPAKAATLVANGYKIIGRYLTGKYAMTLPELRVIFENSLKVIPIFEVGGYYLSYFSYLQGTSDAKSAIAAANALGIPNNSIIYFAVDFDAIDIDVTNNIIPYFKAIKDTFTQVNLNLHSYKIGIYAPRNVCSRVANAGYSCSSFVCDMSSGFSGNLGYSLPKDWALDQISTVSLGTDTSYIEVDNDISSGRDTGISYVEEIILLLKKLDIAAKSYLGASVNNSIGSRNILVYNYLRSFKYTGVKWLGTLGSTDTAFAVYLNTYYSDIVSAITPYIRLNDTLPAYLHGKKVDLPHLAATTVGYSRSVLSLLVPDFWTGWGGDIATAMADLTNLKNTSTNASVSLDILASQVIGNVEYSCPRLDIEADIDAIYFAQQIQDDALGNIIDNYYSNVNGNTRRNVFFKSLGLITSPSDASSLDDTIYSIMTGSSGFGKVPDGSALKAFATTKSGISPTQQVIEAVTLAFSKYILNML